MSASSETQPSLPAALRLGPVALVVTNLDRSVGFYERSLGLRARSREQGEAGLGAGEEELLRLIERPDARPAGRHAGLYHFALLHPSRTELARAARRLADTGTAISGASDHGISEAIYLSDPDGNGIELAADRPRERWGDLRDPTTIGPAPFDLDELVEPLGAEPAPERADPGLRIGHLHLHVGDIERALALYRDLVGFEVMTRFPSAAFIAAGGYHHHLGLNTWRGEGVPAAPPDAVGLDHWTVLLPSRDDVEALGRRLGAGGVDVDASGDGAGIRFADPWDNRLEVGTAR